MKTIWKIQTLLLLSLCAMWGCSEDPAAPTEEQPVMPRVTYPVTEAERSAYVDAPVRFEALIESPGPLDCGWYVGEELVATTPTMTYVFKTVGMYDVRFEASNVVGKSEKSYTVEILGTPMEISFSNEESTIACQPGEEVKISAKVLSGDKQVEHKWLVGEEEISTTTQFAHAFAAAGSYTITYKAINADGVEVLRQWTVVVDELPLEIDFSTVESTIECSQGSTQTITATVKNGGSGLVHEWKIDNTIVATTAEFKHTFDAAGTYTVSYKGVNTKAETITHSWTFKVVELPLAIDFTPTEATLSATEGDQLSFKATVKSGGTGLMHEWKIDDVVEPAAAELTYTFATAGTYTVSYKGVNTKAETVTHSWSVTVTAAGAKPGFLFEDFEARTSLPGHFTNGNAGIEGTTLQANPYKTVINPSEKVLRDLLKQESSTSGFFDVGFAHVANREKYRAVRVKIYIGENLYYPRLKIASLSGAPNKLPSMINGKAVTDQSAANWKSLIKVDDWNVFVYDLVDCGFGASNFGAITAMQFRPLSNLDGSNCSGRDDKTNNRTVYYDDFEFVE